MEAEALFRIMWHYCGTFKIEYWFNRIIILYNCVQSQPVSSNRFNSNQLSKKKKKSNHVHDHLSEEDGVEIKHPHLHIFIVDKMLFLRNLIRPHSQDTNSVSKQYISAILLWKESGIMVHVDVCTRWKEVISRLDYVHRSTQIIFFC